MGSSPSGLTRKEDYNFQGVVPFPQDVSHVSKPIQSSSNSLLPIQHTLLTNKIRFTSPPTSSNEGSGIISRDTTIADQDINYEYTENSSESNFRFTEGQMKRQMMEDFESMYCSIRTLARKCSARIGNN